MIKKSRKKTTRIHVAIDWDVWQFMRLGFPAARGVIADMVNEHIVNPTLRNDPLPKGRTTTIAMEIDTEDWLALTALGDPVKLVRRLARQYYLDRSPDQPMFNLDGELGG